MNTEWDLQDIKDYIWLNYNADDTYGIPYETGNYDDTYLMGKQHGKTELLYQLGQKLGMNLDEPQYSEDNHLWGVS